MNKKVIVIGGDAAGLSAASQIKRRKKDWHVIVFEKSKFISYAACGMPYYVEGLISHFESLLELKPEIAINDRGIDLKINHEVINVNPEKSYVEVKNGSKSFKENYDYLVIATGAHPIKPDFPINSNKVFTISDLIDLEKLEGFIKKNKPQKCAVIGGGLIAIEMAEAFIKKGFETHLIHRRDSLARMFEKEVSDAIIKEMEKERINLHLNSKIESIENGNIFLTDKNLNFDLILLATGMRPATEFIEDTSIELGIKNTVKVNNLMQTNFENIYAAGDCAETTNLVSGEKIFSPLALKANKEGFIAGVNISGEKETFPGVCETAITKFCDLGIARTGLTLELCESLGIDAIKYNVLSRTKARYYPNSKKINTFVILDKNKGKLLGAQMIGPLDSVKRIDVFATALYNKMTINDIFNLDLAYSPPFSPVWDPVLIAARIGKKYVSK